jgi:hypothetical protein
MTTIEIGDRVKRRPVNAFRYSSDNIGTVVGKTTDGRNKIKWDIKAKTGQQHSTIQSRFLIKMP